MFCYEITVHTTGKVEYTRQINLYRSGIEVGGGGRGMPSTFISTNIGLRSRLTTSDQQYITEAEIIVGGHGKTLLIESWKSSLLNDKVLVLCHVLSSGRASTTPDEHVKTWAYGERWKNPRPRTYASLGTISERLMVMRQGSQFTWRQVNKGGKEHSGTIIYDGRGREHPFRFVAHTPLKATG